MMAEEPIIMIIAAIFGAIVGSFLNVVILRLPQENGSIIYPASHCPKCQTPLSWYENIPVLSYLVQYGKCRHCHTTISLQYPVVEILMALLSAALLHRFGLSVQAGGFFVFSAALLVIIFIDLKHQIIPDVISLPGIIIGLLFSLVNPQLHWLDSLLGALGGGGLLYSVALIYYFWRKQDGMGGGDIKLLAMLGAFLGWQSLPFIIFASSLSGSLVGIIFLAAKKKDSTTRIPFGPFLSLSALVYLFWDQEIQAFFHSYLAGEWP